MNESEKELVYTISTAKDILEAVKLATVIFREALSLSEAFPKEQDVTPPVSA